MKKIKNNKGFTLAELLIVIAIIAALVAIMIPTFGGQVEKAREAADLANLRAAYADATMKYLNGTDVTNGTVTVPVQITQTRDGWNSDIDADTLPFTITTMLFSKGNDFAEFTFENNTGKALDKPTVVVKTSKS